MLISPEMWEQAGARWRRRETERTSEMAVAKGSSRPRLRVERLTKTAATEKARAAVLEATAVQPAAPRATEEFSLERVLGKRDLLDENFLELAIAMARTVARVRLRNGFGTGFLVSPFLLMTNQHVIEDISDARGARAEFDFQKNGSGHLLPVQTFTLDPDRFLLTNKELDFTLVALNPLSDHRVPIERYGWVKLIPEQGKADAGDCVNIIQHPGGELKQIALRSNEVVDIFEEYLHYLTDTEPGSSGSPCFNDQWELIALHHSGVPKTNNDGDLLKANDQVWRQGIDSTDSLVWIANEGVRVSSIVAAVRAAVLSDEGENLVEEMLSATPPNPIELARDAGPKSQPAPLPVNPIAGVNPVSSQNSVTLTIPLQITFSIGTPAQSGDAGPVITSPAPELPAAPPDDSEKVVIDKNYSNRTGFDSSFLTGFSTPVPAMSSAVKADAVTFGQGQARKNLLAYEHFSIAMSRKRRIAILTAVNIDGTQRQSIGPRSGDVWSLDPRISAQFQIDNSAYSHNALDRGHLVRRLDPVWGATAAIARKANNDTFHFTNCSPQHKTFNQGGDMWLGLEDYLLNKASRDQRKLVVFTGPVLRRTDPVFRQEGMRFDIRIPLEYWKVAALVKPGGTKVAAAFIVSQTDLIGDATDLQERFNVHTFQVPISKVESLTGLTFDALRSLDTFSQGTALEKLEDSPAKVLTTHDDIDL